MSACAWRRVKLKEELTGGRGRRKKRLEAQMEKGGFQGKIVRVLHELQLLCERC